MANTTNNEIYALITNLRRESGEQREEILGRLADLNTKVAIQNGNVARNTEIIRGDDRGNEGLLQMVNDLQKAQWKQAGAIAVMVGALEVIFHFVSRIH